MNNAGLWWGIVGTCLLAMSVPQRVKAGAGVATAATREAAIQEATVLMPAQAAIGSVNCTVQSGDGEELYTCTVQWEP